MKNRSHPTQKDLEKICFLLAKNRFLLGRAQKGSGAFPTTARTRSVKAGPLQLTVSALPSLSEAPKPRAKSFRVQKSQMQEYRLCFQFSIMGHRTKLVRNHVPYIPTKAGQADEKPQRFDPERPQKNLLFIGEKNIFNRARSKRVAVHSQRLHVPGR